MFRFIILTMLFYLVAKLIKNLMQSPPQKPGVKGTPAAKKALDLSNADIEDADFEEINDQ